MRENISHLYAVLFKTHFWDDFVSRRFMALQERCLGADLWIVVDETHGKIDNISHDKIFRTHDTDMFELGLPEQPHTSLNWFNVDYQLLAFHHTHSDYQFYLMVEYDVAVHRDLDSLVSDAIQRSVDLIAFPILLPIDSWFWTYTLDALWPREEMQRQLLCISGFSQRAVAHLLAARLELAARYKRGELLDWPFCEGFVPTILKNAGFNLESLTYFGSTSNYEWWPPHHESELTSLSEQAFVHPVLRGERYVSSILRYSPPEEYLLPGSKLFQQLSLEPPEIVVSLLIQAFLNNRNGTPLTALRHTVMDWTGADIKYVLELLLAAFTSNNSSENSSSKRFAYKNFVGVPPIGSLDAAADGATSAPTISQSLGTLIVSGWAADYANDGPARSVQVLVDGESTGLADLGFSRPDVAAHYSRPAWSSVGFQFALRALELGLGTHTVECIATSSLGLTTTFGPLTIAVTT